MGQVARWAAATGLLLVFLASGWFGGRAYELHAHRVAQIRSAAPFTYLVRLPEENRVRCVEEGASVDCQAWLWKHFAEVCAWAP